MGVAVVTNKDFDLIAEVTGQPVEPPCVELTGAGTGWASGPGVIDLTSGRSLRGRSLRRDVAGERPQFGLYLGGRPREFDWENRWLSWPDFGLPRDREAFRAAVLLAWARSKCERVEVACAGGRGRTGTALACIAIVDGVDPADAVRFVRAHYDRRAVETPWQKKFVARFRVDH